MHACPRTHACTAHRLASELENQQLRQKEDMLAKVNNLRLVYSPRPQARTHACAHVRMCAHAYAHMFAKLELEDELEKDADIAVFAGKKTVGRV